MKYFGILTLVAGLTSCGGEKGQTETKAKIEGYANKKIYITSSLVNDSVMTDKNGKFKYSMILTDPAYVRFMSDDKAKGFILLLDPEDEASVNVADSSDWQKEFTVEGSESSELLVELGDHYQTSLTALETIKQQYSQDIISATGEEDQKRINTAASSSYDSIVSIERTFLQEYVKKNINSLAAISALYQTFDYRTGMPILLEDNGGIGLFIEADSVLWARFPTSPDVQSFHQNVLQIRAEMEKQKNSAQSPLTQLSIGSEAPDISMEDPNGKILSLHSLRGKYVLLDFWASWCGPCREESPVLVDVYKKYNSKGFEIFQVSLDKTKKAWTDAISKDGLAWKYHVSDLQFWNSVAALLYGVQGIPANFLLDKNGVIVAKNLRGSELEATLAKLIK